MFLQATACPTLHYLPLGLTAGGRAVWLAIGVAEAVTTVL
jgi:hypothetical protein